MNYNKISTVIEDVIDMEGFVESSDISTMKKLANAKLNEILPPTDYMIKIELLDLDNGKVRLPFYRKIVQLAYKYIKEEDKIFKVKWVDYLYQPTIRCDSCGKELKDCSCKSPEVVFNVGNWELPEFMHLKMNILYGTIPFGRYSSIIPEFVLMKPSTHEFFNADIYIPGCLNLNEKLLINNNVEYKIENDWLYVNKKKGKVLISYMVERTDEEGFRMIPDIEEVYKTLKWYIIETMAYRHMNKATSPQDRSFYEDKWLRAEQRRELAEMAAIEVLNTPEFKNWWDFLEQYYFQMLKDTSTEDYFGVKTPDQYNLTMERLTNHG